MKKKKLFLWLGLCLLLLICVVGVVVVLLFGGAEPDNPDGPSMDGVSITLSHSLLTLDRYEAKTLIANVTRDSEPIADASVAWTSSDPSVVSVDDRGVVVPTGEGHAVVTATYGSVSAECPIDVSDSGIIPVLLLERGEIALSMLDTEYKINAYVSYKNEDASDAVFTYSVDDPNVAEVSAEGVIQPKSLGETYVSLTVSWRGYTELYGVIMLKVNPDLVLQMTGCPDEIYIYNGVLDGTRFSNTASLTASVFVNDEAVESPKLTWHSSDETVLTVSADGVISAKDFGTATVWYTYDIDGTAYSSAKEEVAVALATLDKTDSVTTLFDLSTADGRRCKLSANDVFGVGDYTVTKVYTVENPSVNLYADGFVDVTGIDGEQIFVVANSANYAYKVQGIVITDVITTADEFFDMNNNLGGYYVLGNDIDFSGQIVNSKTDGTGWNSIGWVTGTSGDIAEYNKFTGTFDGRGYSLKNLTVNGYNASQGINASVFGFTSGATIKNVMVDMTIGAVNKNTVKMAGFIARADATVIDNCMITLHTNQAGYGSFYTVGAIAGHFTTLSKMTNCIAVLDTSEGIISDNKTNFGILVGTSGGSTSYITNCYGIYVGERGDTWSPAVGGSVTADQVTMSSVGVYKGMDNFCKATADNMFSADGWSEAFGWENSVLSFSGNTIYTYEAKTEIDAGVYTLSDAPFTVSGLTGTVTGVSCDGLDITADCSTSVAGSLEIASDRMDAVVGSGEKYLTVITDAGVKYSVKITVIKVITTADEFFAISNNLSGYYVLGNDIDFSAQVVNPDSDGNGWKTIGWNSAAGGSVGSYNPFTGIFDGNGYALKGLTINGHNGFQGVAACLFGYAKNATIKNVMAEITIGSTIRNDTLKSAGLIGRADYTTIDNCAVIFRTGQASYKTDEQSVGAIAGQLAFGSKITNCIAILDTSAGITSTNKTTFGTIAGIGGGDAASITNCYGIYIGAQGDTWEPALTAAAAGTITESDSEAYSAADFATAVTELPSSNGWSDRFSFEDNVLKYADETLISFE